VPFTPLHLGPALFVGLLAARWLDLPALAAASVVVDVRAALVLFGVLDGPIHGPLTTFAGATVVAAVVAPAAYQLRPSVDPLLATLGLRQHRSVGRAITGALAGAWLHVLLDAPLYGDVHPFAPLSAANPLLGVVSPTVVYGGCAVAGLAGTGLYGVHLHGVALPGLDAGGS
jgi:hypothetical protein